MKMEAVNNTTKVMVLETAGVNITKTVSLAYFMLVMETVRKNEGYMIGEKQKFQKMLQVLKEQIRRSSSFLMWKGLLIVDMRK